MRTEAGKLAGQGIAVTGGTGFIGSRLVGRLLEEGASVRALARTPSAMHPGVEVVPGDIRDPTAVARLVQGADLVFHLAALARAWAPNPADFQRVNVDGTRNLLTAALAARVRRVIHVSTELVDGPETPYGRTKRHAEEVVRDYVARGGDAVIVRPTRVYGPGPLNPSNFATRVIALYRKGWFRLRLADGGVRASYVYVDDVVDGLLRAAERGVNGAVYLLGGENLRFTEFLDLIGEVTGRRLAMLAVAPSLARLVGILGELGGRLRGLGIEPLLTRDWVAVLVADRPWDSSAAIRELGYRPRSAREGIAATIAWLERQ